jgi:hypothetical protein
MTASFGPPDYRDEPSSSAELLRVCKNAADVGILGLLLTGPHESVPACLVMELDDGHADLLAVPHYSGEVEKAIALSHWLSQRLVLSRARAAAIVSYDPRHGDPTDEGELIVAAGDHTGASCAATARIFNRELGEHARWLEDGPEVALARVPPALPAALLWVAQSLCPQ